jgi:hypothetical protein
MGDQKERCEQIPPVLARAAVAHPFVSAITELTPVMRATCSAAPEEAAFCGAGAVWGVDKTRELVCSGPEGWRLVLIQ